MKQKIAASLFALLIALPFGGIGLGAAYLIAAMIHDGVRARDWVLVKAEVTGPASYRYTIGGKTYEGTRLGTLHIAGTGDIDDFEDRVSDMLLQGREQKKPITVFVNPDEPSEAMVDREIRWGLVLFLAPFALLFSWIGLGALWLIRRLSTGETPEGASNTAGAGVLWLFAIVWNAISFPAAIIAIPQGMADGEWGVLFILLFPIIGLGVLWAAIAGTFERLRRWDAPSARPLNKQRRPT
jgi:hypothetical protein